MAKPIVPTWYDAENQTPSMVCEVITSDDTIHKARYVCGSWETLEGVAIIYPVSWRPLQFSVLTPLFTINDLL